ncbi:hypothetical protein Tco_0227008 [Tanacetum coccineum]
MVMAARRWCGSGGVMVGWRRWRRFGEGDNRVGVERDEVGVSVSSWSLKVMTAASDDVFNGVVRVHVGGEIS